jgi:uncharacterized delta-60 repeat protein
MTDGSVDLSFVVGSGFNNTVFSLALQPDGKVIAGGDFTQYNGVNVSSRLARLNSDGTLDSGFTSGGPNGFDNTVLSLALQPDGKVIVGGAFLQYNSANVNTCLARLNSNGTIDPSFTSGGSNGFNGIVTSLILQPDGKVIVGGVFSQYKNVNINDYLVRLNSNGTLDSGFTSGGPNGFDGAVRSLALQPDGKVIVGGDFSQYNGVNVNNRLVRLNSNGTLDPGFTSGGATGFNNSVYSLALQPDGKILAGGFFGAYNGVGVNSYLVRLNSDGTLDSGFTSGGPIGFNNPVFSLGLQPDGKILVGGALTAYNGVIANAYLARLNSDGTIDPGFTGGVTGFDDRVYSLVLQPDGKVIAGGQFLNYNFDSSNRVIRLNNSVPTPIPTTFSVSSTDSKIQNYRPVNSKIVKKNFKMPISSVPGYAPGSMCVSSSGNILIRNQDGTITTF